MKYLPSKTVTAAVAAVALAALAGCGVQTKIIRERHWDLNQMIRQTSDEQLMLNIVRLRYDEMPYFLQIASVTTSFSASANAAASGTIPENGPNVVGLSAGASYSETPTVTWALPDSREFLGRLLAPMGADQLSVLAQSGLDLSLVYRIGVKKMNRLRNLEFNLQEGVYTPPTYDDFLEALALIETLRKEDLLDLAYGVYSTKGGGNIPLSQLNTRAMAEALPYGMQFMTREGHPTVFEPLKLSRPLFVRFSKRSDADPRARRLRDLLSLDPTAYSFAIIDTGNSSVEQLLAESQQPSRVEGSDAPLREIVVNNRSVMDVLRFASAYVEVPAKDLARGVVSKWNAPPLRREWLNIRFSKARPANAWLKVEHRGMWYYVAADDLNSRISFMLLSSLFSSVVGEIPGAKPLLTLPVK
jgi:hypothetical protein